MTCGIDDSRKIIKITLFAIMSTLLMMTFFACGTSDSTALGNSSNDKSSTGIKVHGDWIITVHNPDGEITSTYEFENELHDEGSSLLINLLAGNSKITSHSLYLMFMHSTCIEGDDDGQSGIGHKRTIPASIVQTYSAPGSLMLSGFCTVTSIGSNLNRTLVSAATRFSTDGSDLTKVSKFSNKNIQIPALRLTEKSFLGVDGNGPLGMPVTEGQKIAINVKLTFD